MNASREKQLKLLIALCRRLDKPPAKYRAELAALKQAHTQVNSAVPSQVFDAGQP